MLIGQTSQSTTSLILTEENRPFKQHLQGRRLNLSDDDRRRPAAKARRLGRQVLAEVANLVTPVTLLVWYRISMLATVPVSRRVKCRDT